MKTQFRLVPAVVLSSLALALIPLAASAEDSGQQVVNDVCSSCHTPGLMGAPRIGDSADWQARFKHAGSVRALTESAEHGKGNMPPRGGESTLSDNEVQSATQYMLGKSGVTY